MWQSRFQQTVAAVFFAAATPALAAPPTAVTTSATSLTRTSAVLLGEGSPEGEPTTGWFRISETNPVVCDDQFGSRMPTAGGAGLGAGSALVPYSTPVAGLSPGTMHYYCAITENASGLSFGAVSAFTTHDLPTVSLLPTSGIAATSATLNAVGVANGATATGWFRYSLTDPGVCSDNFGVRLPSTGGSALGSGILEVSYSRNASALVPGGTYYACALASNAYGVVTSEMTSFTLPPEMPTVSVGFATSVTGTTMLMQATGNPRGGEAVGWFRYSTQEPFSCNDQFGVRLPATGGISLGSVTGEVAFSQPVTGLQPDTSYSYCAFVENSAGVAISLVRTLTTAGPPVATTSAPSQISDDSAVLLGSVLTNGSPSTAWFRYSEVHPGTCNDTFGQRTSPDFSTASTSSSPVSYLRAVSGLSPGTSYYYCAIASNGEGMGFGEVLSFTTPAQPSVVTTSPNPLSAASATLNGIGNPRGATATGWFRVSTTDPGACTDDFGTRVPLTGGVSLGSTHTDRPFSSATSVVAGTTYYYCAFASNTYGRSAGSVVSFTSPTTAPSVATSPATLVTGTAAQLNGTTNPGGTHAVAWFRTDTTNPGVCTDTFGTRWPLTGGVSIPVSNEWVLFDVLATGLVPGQTYYFCAFAENAQGTTGGTVRSFVTPLLPEVTTGATTSITNTTARLSAVVTPNGATTTLWFRFSATLPPTCADNFGSRAPAAGGSSAGSGYAPISLDRTVSGLSALTTYYYCALASNVEGAALGTVESFTTLGPPTIASESASDLTPSTATLHARVNPNGAAASGWFRYSSTNPGACTDDFGTRTPPGTGGAVLPVDLGELDYTADLVDLAPNTTYYYCAISSNTYGTSLGVLRSFTTAARLPVVTTVPPTEVTASTATLNGTVRAGGLPTTAWFRYDTVSPGACNDSFGVRAPSASGSSISAGHSDVTFSQPITGLTEGVTYHVCAIAQNSLGTVWGSVVSFVAPRSPSALTLAATVVTSTTASVHGQGSANGTASTGWFRYRDTPMTSCVDGVGERAPWTGGVAIGVGAGTVSFSHNLTGLRPGTTYSYCAVVGSTAATSTGGVLTFRTSTAAPVVVSLDADAVSPTSVVLHGTANPNGATTTGWFRYATVLPSSCNDSFGVRVPATGGTDLGNGNAALPFSETLQGLTPGVTYHYCAIASNVRGVVTGVLKSVTPTGAPSVATNAPGPVGATSAALVGTVIAGGNATVAWFRYGTSNPGTCDDTYGLRAPSSGGTNIGADFTPRVYTVTVTGLTRGTTYYYCAVAESSAGRTFGAVTPFVTADLPVVTTSPATALTASGATLQGLGVPSGSSSTGWFRYSATHPGTCTDSFGTRAPSSGGTALGNLWSSAPFSRELTGLTAGSTYYYCAIAQNNVGMGFGEVLSFRTVAPPTVSTTAASGLGSTTATMQATVTPNGGETTAWFRYASTDPGTCSASFGAGTTPVSVGAGEQPVELTHPLGGLLPSTVYYYCAIAENVAGTVFGELRSFTTPLPPETTTLAVAGLSSTQATLRGTANPRGAATVGWFRYGTTFPGTCNDSFGVRSPAQGGTDLGAGTTVVSFQAPLTGLSPATVYHACAIAQNSEGLRFGEVISFTTPIAPSTTTAQISALAGTSVTLNGVANPNGAASTGWFRYSATDPGTCDDSFGSRAPATSGSSLGAGFADVPYSQSLTGLLVDTTYYACAIAQNIEGTTFGALISFSTPGAPLVITEAASGIGPGTATLRASVTPNGDATTGWFRFSTSAPASCNDSFGTLTSPWSLGSGHSAMPFSETLTGLVAGTTYHFCAIARNSAGTSFGELSSFTTPQAPSTTTLAASSATSTSVTLHATANPNRSATTGWFRYSEVHPGTCSDAVGTRSPSFGGTDLGAGSVAVPFQSTLSGLTVGTTYYYCALSQNALGTSVGAVLSFTTAEIPTVVTAPITGLSANSVELNGIGDPRGFATTGWFRYGTTHPGTCSDGFGVRAPVAGGTSLGAGTGAVPFSETVTGLASGTTYHACAVAQSAEGTVFGAVISFTTPSAPTVVTGSVSAVGPGTATLNALATPNGSATTGWFRFSSTNPGACNETFGTATQPWSLGAGFNPMAYAQPLIGLADGTVHYYCAVAENSAGVVLGELLTFTTPAAPTATTLVAVSLSATTATLQATANPNGQSTTGWFRYSTTLPGNCSDGFGVRAPGAGGFALGAGSTTVPYEVALTGLSPNTTYYYCGLASNAVGTSTGGLLSFTTSPGSGGAAAPSAVTLSAVAAPGGGTTLRGAANPNGDATVGWFRYATTHPGACSDSFGVRAPVAGGTALGSGTTEVPYEVDLTGLSAATTYYFCALAENSLGAGAGAVVSFTTSAVPSVNTNAITGLSARSVELNGVANPRGQPTAGWFRYDTAHPGVCDDSFGTRAPAVGGLDLGAGMLGVPYTQTVTGLLPGTTYHACALAESSEGLAVGGIVSFTTPAAPVVLTLAATDVGAEAATLNASITPRGGATTGWFRYAAVDPGACDDSFGAATPTWPLGAGLSAMSLSEPLRGLQPGTTYYFCAVAENSAGLTFGELLSFATSRAPTVSTLAAVDVSAGAATVQASANPNSLSTTGWFRYSTTPPGACDDLFGVRLPSSGGVALGAGAGAVSFEQPLIGLLPETTYYYCALASNVAGTSVGSVQSFTTPELPVGLQPPLVRTLAATALGAQAATLQGNADPRGQDTTGWFRYASTAPASCDDVFGTRVPSSGGAPLGAGVGEVAFSQAVTGLSSGTTYYYCAVASSAVGTSAGEIRSFTTPGLPVVTTEPAVSVSGSSATLSATANPNHGAATGWFRYATSHPGTCSDLFGSRAPAVGGVELGAGASPVPFSQTVAGLLTDTTYYYCAVVSNAAGTGFGAVQSFTTSVAPVVTTVSVRATSHTTAQLEGSADPRGAASTGWFRYATVHPGACDDLFGTRAPGSGGTVLGSGNGPVAFNASVIGLAPATVYYACAIASSAAGTGFGEVQSFTTADAPEVVTEAATAVGADGAVLRASVNPNLADTGAWFRYADIDPGACNDQFGLRSPASAEIGVGEGGDPVAVQQALTGLNAATTYYYCAVATNVAGTRFGALLTFTTSPDAPTVSTGAVSNLGTDTATLNGVANPRGARTDGWFRYDTADPGACDDSFGSRAPVTGALNLGADAADVPFSLPLTGLVPGQTYYACALARSAYGTSYGEIITFSPGATTPTVVTEAAEEVTGTTAVLLGVANPRGTAASGSFRYGEQDPGACDSSFGDRVPAVGGAALGNGTADVAFDERVTGLLPNATYYYCAAADNLGGVAFGEVVPFSTPTVPPDVTTRPVALLGANLSLVGGAHPQGSETTGWFRLAPDAPGGCDDSFGTRLPLTGGASLGAGRSEVAFEEPLGELAPGTWYVCAIAENAAGISVGEVVTFVIPGDEGPSASCSCQSGAGRGGALGAAFALLVAVGRRRRDRGAALARAGDPAA
jgi:hypothetical protein